MLRKLKLFSMTALIAVMTVLTAKAEITQDYNGNGSDNYSQIKIDRYLDVEVWTNHADNEFYEGDNIVLNFRANRDAFVAIYTIDTKGRVNLLFPASPDDNNYVEGGETYRLPDQSDDFDFVVSGPEGVEHIQIIASKERFPIPDWYPTSGIIDDSQDTFEFMDYINSRYFVKYDGQRFAFDRASVYVNEWEQEYYRPVYYPSYPSWTVSGNCYIDYPYGGSVYINGIYWGVAPLYIPSIYVGWHTVTIYDPYGYCWEHDIHITRYNTVVLNRTIIQTSPNVRSKYKEVRDVGYRDPVKNGYPKYKGTKVVTTKQQTSVTKQVVTPKKKYVRGSTEVVKTSRGYETTGGNTASDNKRSSGRDKYEATYKRQSDKSAGNSYTGRKEDRTTTSSGTYKRESGKSTQSGTPTYKKSTVDKKQSSSKKSTVTKKPASSDKGSKADKKSSVKKSSSDNKDKGSESKSVKKSDSSKKEPKSSGSQKKSSSDKSSKKSGSKKKR